MLKKINIMPTLYRLLLLAGGIAMAGSCEDYIGIVDCDDCWGFKPDSADLVVHVTLNDDHRALPVVVYRGDVEDRQVDWIDTIYETPWYLYSAVDQFYSVAVEYQVGDRTIIAIDGGKMRARDATSSCDFECWIIKGGILKAELKFDE